MNHKIEKYSIRLVQNNGTGAARSRYLYKLARHIVAGQTGGEIVEFKKNTTDTTITENLHELLKLIRINAENKLIKVTKNKYFVILIGPPGSGKSLARKIATKVIGKAEALDNYNVIYDSFIDILVDDFVYGAQINGDETGRDRFKKNLRKIVADEGLDIDGLDLAVHPASVQQIAKESKDIYFDIRKHVEPIGSIMMHIAAYLDLNIFFETVGGTDDYVKFLVNDVCKYYGYVPYRLDRLA